MSETGSTAEDLLEQIAGSVVDNTTMAARLADEPPPIKKFAVSPQGVRETGHPNHKPDGAVIGALRDELPQNPEPLPKLTKDFNNTTSDLDNLDPAVNPGMGIA